MQKSLLKAPAITKQHFPENDSSYARKIFFKKFSDRKFKSIEKLKTNVSEN